MEPSVSSEAFQRCKTAADSEPYQGVPVTSVRFRVALPLRCHLSRRFGLPVRLPAAATKTNMGGIGAMEQDVIMPVWQYVVQEIQQLPEEQGNYLQVRC